MGEDRLNKFLKDKVFHHRTPTDGDALWAKIQAKQEKKKRRPVFWIWGFGAALLVSAVLVGIYFYQNNIVETPTQKMPIAENFNNSAESCPENQETILNNNTQKETKILAESKSNENEPTLTEVTSLTQEKVSSQKKFRSKKLQNQITPFPASKMSPDFVDEDVIDEQSNLKQPIFKEIGKSKQPEIINAQNLLFTLKTPINLIDFDKKEANLNFDPKPDLNKNDDQNSKKKKWQSSIGAHFYYGINQRNLTAKSDSLGRNEIYRTARESSEKTLDVLRGGIDFRLKHKKGFYGKVGLDYQQITEKLTESFVESNTYLADSQVVHIIKYPDGTETELFDSAMVTEIKIFDKKIFNRYRSIEIPFLLGYEKSTKSNWHFFAEAGLSFNVLTRISGEISDENGNNYDLKTDASNWFKDNLGLAILGNIGVGYDLNENWNIWASPSFKYYLSNFSSKENPLNQRYSMVGLEIGVRFGF